MTALEPAAKHIEMLAVVVLSLQMYQMEISPVSESTRMACTALLVGWQRVIWVSLAGSSFQAIPKFQSDPISISWHRGSSLQPFRRASGSFYAIWLPFSMQAFATPGTFLLQFHFLAAAVRCAMLPADFTLSAAAS